MDQTVGLNDVRADITMMRTPDGHGRVELSRFHRPPAVRAGPESAPANALGMRRIMFMVDDVYDVVTRLRSHGTEPVGEITQYEDIYRLCFVRGPEASSSGCPSSSAEAPRVRPGEAPAGRSALARGRSVSWEVEHVTAPHDDREPRQLRQPTAFQ